jgi:fibronectin-binding autotransporter adhesin
LNDRLFQRAPPRTLAALLALAGGAAPAIAHAQASDIDTAQPAYLASGLGTTVNPAFRGGVLKTDQPGGAYAHSFTLDGSGANTIDQAGATTTFSGTFSDAAMGTPGSLILDDSVGGGGLTLSGASTYTGATTVRAGTLSLTGRIDSSSGVALTGVNAVFDVSNLSSSTEIKGLSGVAGSRVRLGAKGLTVNQAGATTFAGDISGSGASGFIKSGIGTLTLSGDNGYTNLTTISGGVLALSGAGSIAASSGVADDATFDISATTSGAAITTLSGNGVVALGSKTLTLTAAADTFGGVIGGTGGLTVSGGTETLTGANTYTGVTKIDAGATLSLSGTGAIANSSNAVVNGTFDISATTSGASTGALSGSGHVVLGGETLTLTHGSGSFSGTIDGTGGLVVSGGSQTLSGANGYTGGTSISGGVLTLTGAGTLGAPGGTLSMSGGVLDLGGTSQSIGAISLRGGRVIGGALSASAYDVESGEIAVVLAGAATLTQSGSGVTTLTQANTYTGQTTISSGTLALSGSGSISASSRVVDNGVFDISATTDGAAITRLSGHGAVALGARTLTLTGANDTFSGVIGGSGGLTLRGGSETLSGANSFTGAATIDTGATLRLAGAGGVSASSLVTANGTFDISATPSGAAITSLAGAGHVALGDRMLLLTRASGDFSGDIAGAGGVAVTGGTQTLSGVNTYAGGALVAGGGTLAVRSDAALGGAPSGVALDGGILLATGDLMTARTVLVEAGGGTIRTGLGAIGLTGQVLLEGDLSVGGGGRTTVSGRVDGQGALNLVDGLFYDNGTITAGAVTVAQAATLRGVGVINAPTTVSGTLAPGASPGTLTFNAPVTLLAGATSQFDIDGLGTGSGAGHYGRVVVNGPGGSFTAGGVLAPRLRGMTGSAGNSYTPPIGQQFQIILAGGGVAGGFASLTQPDGLAAGTRFDAVYAPTSLSLVVTPAAYADLAAAGIAQTANQKAIGAALDADRPAAGVRPNAARAAIYDPLYGLSAGQVPAALNGLSPEIYADGLMAARQAWREGAGVVGDQLADRRGARPAGSGEVMVWGGLFGQSGDVGPAGGGYSTAVGGMVVGVDRTLEQGGLVGLALGLANARAEAPGGGRAQGDMIQAMAYGGLVRGPAFLDWQVDYLRMDLDLSRPGGPLRGQVRGGSTVQGAGLQVSAGWGMTVRRWRVEPTASLGAVGLTTSSSRESPGDALAEEIAGQDNTGVQAFAGVGVARMVRLAPDLSLQVRGLVGWSHEMGDTAAEARASLVQIGGAPFTVTSAAPGRDAARLGVSFSAAVSPRIMISGAYSGEFARERDSQSLTTGFRARW